MLAYAMKNRIGVIVLVVLCLGLGIGLIASRKQASEQEHQDAERIEVLSNKWVKTSGDLEEQKQVAAMYEKDLDGRKKALNELTNSYSQLAATLTQVSTKLSTTEASLQTSQQELAKQSAELSTSLTNLTTQIAETQRKLTASEGDKVFLEKELKRLIAEKAELERQFNDLTVMKAQVAKLKQELNISRRLEWIRQGLFANAEQKGAQKLMQGAGTSQAVAKAPKPAYDLNVEVGADGAVKVIPPLNDPAGATNPPPAK
jgi:chromosome segregation ATPase